MLERYYGVGLTELYGHDGRVVQERLRSPRYNGITVTYGPTTFDAIKPKAFALGFVVGQQYTGLTDGDSSNPLPNEAVPLTDCFAATYAFFENVEKMQYDIATINSEPGTFKGINIVLTNPLFMGMDSLVTYE